MPREIVYVGMDDFTLALPEPVDGEKPAGFTAVFHLTDLDALHGRYDPPFTHVQMICVVSKPLRGWDSYCLCSLPRRPLDALLSR